MIAQQVAQGARTDRLAVARVVGHHQHAVFRLLVKGAVAGEMKDVVLAVSQLFLQGSQACIGQPLERDQPSFSNGRSASVSFVHSASISSLGNPPGLASMTNTGRGGLTARSLPFEGVPGSAPADWCRSGPGNGRCGSYMSSQGRLDSSGTSFSRKRMRRPLPAWPLRSRLRAQAVTHPPLKTAWKICSPSCCPGLAQPSGGQRLVELSQDSSS